MPLFKTGNGTRIPLNHVYQCNLYTVNIFSSQSNLNVSGKHFM